jgi:hypothetical protein
MQVYWFCHATVVPPSTVFQVVLAFFYHAANRVTVVRLPTEATGFIYPFSELLDWFWASPACYQSVFGILTRG